MVWSNAAGVSLAESDVAAVLRLIDTGHYESAERLARELCGTGLSAGHRHSFEDVDCLDRLIAAMVLNGTAATGQAMAMAEETVRLREARQGPRHLDVARPLHNLAAVRAAHGALISATRLHERGLAIRLAASDKDSPSVAESLEWLAWSLIARERYAEAATHVIEARRIRESTPERSRELANSLELHAMWLRFMGRYSEAVPLVERALEIRSRATPGHPAIILALKIRGLLEMLMGDAQSARNTWEQAVTLAETTLRDSHPVIVEVLRLDGNATYALGDIGGARQLWERGLTIGQAALAPCDPELPSLFNDLAMAQEAEADLHAARNSLSRARGLVERCRASGVTDGMTDAYATITYNEAGLVSREGDFDIAENLARRAADTWAAWHGSDHPFVARALDRRAEIVAASGRLATARSLYLRALAARRRSLGASHPQVAWTLTNIAENFESANDHPAAVRYVDEALRIYDQTRKTDAPDHLGRMLELKGRLLQRLGDGGARGTLTRALEEFERVYGPSHASTARARLALARVDFADGQQRRAAVAALAAELAVVDTLRNTIRYLPERQALAAGARRERALDLALSIAVGDGTEPVVSALNALIRSRGVILDEMAARARPVSSADTSTDALREAAGTARQRLANLVMRSLREPVARTTLDEARQRKEDAERSLAERSATARAEQQRAQMGLDDVRRALPTGAALVSFVRYERTQVPTPGAGLRPPVPAYGAFVTPSDAASPIAFVDMGSAAPLDSLVTEWRRDAGGRLLLAGASAARAEREYRRIGERLRKAAWDPLLPHLGGAASVFIVPDGLLNVVSFAALPAADGSYLVESGPVIHYLSTERDLATPGPVAGPQSLLALGGAAFDFRATSRPRAAINRAIGCDPLGRLRFEDLPGSRREATEIAAAWSAAGAGPSDLLSDRGATEAALKKSLAGRRVIHLATHGFLLGNGCGPTNGLRAVGTLAPAKAAAPAASALTDNPLLLSGLALAGANQGVSARLDDEDGILTAEEIAGLDLTGTEWAVLSACETGLGQIRTGEGVFGLRRAFQVAGVRTVIMSLWSVQDEATRVWMRHLYENRLTRRLNTADAVHAATLTVLQERRAKGQSTHPFYWAAFVAAGDWR
jgi:CHAT domain-containing protein/tetratricopeptide (TPR) repeat protein